MTEIETTDRPGAALREALWDYLLLTGWSLLDADTKTSLLAPPDWSMDDRPLRVAVPQRGVDLDGSEAWLIEAAHVISNVERRSLDEVLSDVTHGGADTLSIRSTPDAPSGQAPLGEALEAVAALKSLAAGSAAGVEDPHAVVLPSRRPAQAELFARSTRLSTGRGSFVLHLALPLGQPAPSRRPVDEGQGSLLDMPIDPFGRLVARRLETVLRTSLDLARRVNDGDLRLQEAFGGVQPAGRANATELDALARLSGGGDDRGKYHLRIAESPVAASSDGRRVAPLVLAVTPAEQLTFERAADHLRKRQPLSGVTVTGLVVQLKRDQALGPGDVIVLGVGDDSGEQRRYRVELSEADYARANYAHGEGLRVTVTGDVDVKGQIRRVVRLKSFDVVPGLEE